MHQSFADEAHGQQHTDALRCNTAHVLIMSHDPRNVDRAMLMEFLERQGLLFQIDCLYLPIQIRNNMNNTYAILGFTSPVVARKCMDMSGVVSWGTDAAHVVAVEPAIKFSDCESFIARFRNSPMMHNLVPDEFKPILLRDGVRIPFPPSG